MRNSAVNILDFRQKKLILTEGKMLPKVTESDLESALDPSFPVSDTCALLTIIKGCFQQFYHGIPFFTVVTVVSTGVTLSFLLWKLTRGDLHFAKG